MQLREGYSDWRQGKAKGCKHGTEDVSGYMGWRLDKTVNWNGEVLCHVENVMHSMCAGLLWRFDRQRALAARRPTTRQLQLDNEIEDLKAQLKQLQLENEIATLQAELQQIRAQHPKQVQWADSASDVCSAKPGRTTQKLGGSAAAKVRPIWRRHIFGTELPPSKLSPSQVQYRKDLIGQQVRVLQGPDTNLTGILQSVSLRGYATLKLVGPGSNIIMTPQVAANPAARHVLTSRCVYSYAIEPTCLKTMDDCVRTAGFNSVSFLRRRNTAVDVFDYSDTDADAEEDGY